MKVLRPFLLILLVVLVIIQFIKPKRNLSTVRSASNIAAIYPTGPAVTDILHKACNDCHSNNTRYPWYANIQPVAWWLDHHVQEGKRELNFDEFGTYSLRKQYHKLEELVDQVKEGEMPLSSYTLIHTDAKLTDQEKETVTAWADSLRANMEASYPKDSLIRKK